MYILYKGQSNKSPFNIYNIKYMKIIYNTRYMLYSI